LVLDDAKVQLFDLEPATRNRLTTSVMWAKTSEAPSSGLDEAEDIVGIYELFRSGGRNEFPSISGEQCAKSTLQRLNRD